MTPWRWTVIGVVLAGLCAGAVAQGTAAELPADRLVASGPSSPTLDTAWVDGVYDASVAAFSYGDFDALESLYDKVVHTTATDSHGEPAPSRFTRGLRALFNISDPYATDLYYANLDALTDAWLVDHPTSKLALGIRLRALYARAWWYRGGGYSSTVSPQQRALFDRTIERAIAVAKAHVITSDDVLTNGYLVMVARSANLSWKQQQALVRGTLDAHPEEFDVWEELVVSAEPKWGGDWDAVDRLVRDAASRQKTPSDGDVMYARLWAYLSFDLQGGFFDSPVDWVRLKRGLQTIVARYPRSDAVTDFAKLACLRGDRVAADAMMSRIGDEPDIERWGGGTSGRSAFDRCRSWLRDGNATLPVTPPRSPPPGVDS